MNVSQRVLGNGLAVVGMPVAGRLATAMAIAFPAGSRHENPTEIGAAHLLEHLVFKGTEDHPSATALNRAAEVLGTELDGATTTDYVEFSTLVRAESSMALIELLCELVATPLLPEAELDDEREVVLQEIADYNDNPGSRADDLLIASLFRGHRLAHRVTGEADHLRGLTLHQLLAFRDRQWSTDAGVVAITGNLDHLDQRRLEDMLSAIPSRPRPPAPAQLPPFTPGVACEQHDADTVHLRLAYHVPGLNFTRRRDRAVAEVFSQLIGGPMGSRLFDELREQRALCYWVDGHVWGYESATFLSISCSVGPSHLEETYERIRGILDSLRATGPTDEEHRRFGAYSAGAAALDFDSVSGRLDHAVELIMEYGDHGVDPSLHLREIESVTRRELAELADRIELEPCVGCVGPVTEAHFGWPPPGDTLPVWSDQSRSWGT